MQLLRNLTLLLGALLIGASLLAEDNSNPDQCEWRCDSPVTVAPGSYNSSLTVSIDDVGTELTKAKFIGRVSPYVTDGQKVCETEDGTQEDSATVTLSPSSITWNLTEGAPSGTVRNFTLTGNGPSNKEGCSVSGFPLTYNFNVTVISPCTWEQKTAVTVSKGSYTADFTVGKDEVDTELTEAKFIERVTPDISDGEMVCKTAGGTEADSRKVTLAKGEITWSLTEGSTAEPGIKEFTLTATGPSGKEGCTVSGLPTYTFTVTVVDINLNSAVGILAGVSATVCLLPGRW